MWPANFSSTLNIPQKASHLFVHTCNKTFKLCSNLVRSIILRCLGDRVLAISTCHNFFVVVRCVVTVTVPICDRDFRNLIANLEPFVACRRDWKEPAEEVVRPGGDDEASKEVQIINMLRADGNFLADSPRKSHDVDENAGDVSGISTPVETEGVVIGPCLLARVEVSNLKIALAYPVVITNHDASDRGKEDRVSAKVGGEAVGIFQQLPGTHDQPNEGADVTAAANVDPAWRQSSHIGTRRNGICGDVRSQLGKRESGGYDEDSEALAVTIVFFEERLEKNKRVPDGITAKNDRGGGRYDDTDEARDGESKRDRDKLGPERVLWLAGKSGKVRIIHNKCRKVGNGGHDAANHEPTQCGAFGGTGLLDNGTDSLCANDGPDEESKTSRRYKVGLDGEEMADLVDGEPDGGQTTQPEQEEAHECHRVCARGRNSIFNASRAASLVGVAPVVPDAADHEVDAGTTNPGLHAIPDTGHGSAVKDRP